MALALPNQWGQAPQGSNVERLFALGYDAILIPPATSVVTQNFWDQTQTKPAPYRTTVLTQLAQQKAVTITGLQLVHNLNLDSVALQTGSTEAAASFIDGFNQFSYVQITVLQKAYDKIPLADLVPYFVANFANTASVLTKQFPIFMLPEGIEVPAGGDIQIAFIPNPGYTTVAAAVSTPHLPGISGLTNNQVYNVTLKYYGVQQRPVA